MNASLCACEIAEVAPHAEGGLIVIAQPSRDDGAVARGVIVASVPPGPLAVVLASAMRPGQLWRLRFSADGGAIVEAWKVTG